jgi:hypothetical protein
MIITFKPLVAVLTNEGCIVARLYCAAMVHDSEQTIPSKQTFIKFDWIQNEYFNHYYLLSLLETPLVYESSVELLPEPGLQPIFDAMKGVISRY